MKPSARPRKFRAALSGNGQEAAGTGSSGHIDKNSSVDVYARIAELAYSLYERRGREDGHDVEDWIQAEETVLSTHDGVAAKTGRTSRRVVIGGKAAEGQALPG
jgi:Protein of unknown function (DUF2934)